MIFRALALFLIAFMPAGAMAQTCELTGDSFSGFAEIVPSGAEPFEVVLHSVPVTIRPEEDTRAIQVRGPVEFVGNWRLSYYLDDSRDFYDGLVRLTPRFRLSLTKEGTELAATASRGEMSISSMPVPCHALTLT